MTSLDILFGLTHIGPSARGVWSMVQGFCVAGGLVGWALGFVLGIGTEGVRSGGLWARLQSSAMK